MIKNLIAPIQAWLLSQNRCVGCGENLKNGKTSEVRGKNLCTCRCGRIFVHELSKDTYRRAMFDEV